MSPADDLGSEAWMESVAELLPVPHRAPAPFTLGEAVAELGLWATTARDESWRRRGTSLDLDVAAGLAKAGPRLLSALDGLVPNLSSNCDRQVIADAAQQFKELWGQPSTIGATFDDLCEAATSQTKPAWELKPLAEFLVSQVGETNSGWDPLRRASSMLAGRPNPFDLDDSASEEAGGNAPSSVTRLSAARSILLARDPLGRVVVWLLYRRARVDQILNAGPITFFNARWAIPNARSGAQHFKGREELAGLLGDHFAAVEDDRTLDDWVLARVDLGERFGVGAAEDAARNVEALLSIAIEAGGVSWVYTGTSATLISGINQMSTYGAARRHDSREFRDTYGIRATSNVLSDWAERLNAALIVGPMPNFLVEALNAVREASLIEHRDVKFYNTRPVTPRVAVALEDHAVELISSLAGMSPDSLRSAIAEGIADREFDQLILTGLLAPIDRGAKSAETAESAKALERVVSKMSPEGVRVIDLEKVWEFRAEIQALPVSPVVRATFESALAAITSPHEEVASRERVRQSVSLYGSRHRRVRNAVTHGNPVSAAAIASVRNFSERLARDALGLGLHAYAGDERISTVLHTAKEDRDTDSAALANGSSFLDRMRSGSTSTTSAPGDASER